MPELKTFVGRDEKTGVNKVVKFRWKFQHASSNAVLLSFLAEQEVGYENIHLFTVHDIKRVVWESWMGYSRRLFEKLRSEKIKVSFSLFDMTEQDLNKLLQTLK
jgi:hypothetical protein